ncbi:MAG TPA: hypothetical protein VMA36_02295 [Candidatus Limnocylindria bacterium]|jgi:hypothetical protein|nr:hypothetical protein [Candidatus Limnocylindria bacterium]
MTKVLFSSLAVTALAAAIAAPAVAQTQTAYVKDPIAVEGFSADSDFSPRASQWFDGINITGLSSDVTISFVNTANVPAKSVEFAVRAGKHTCLIVDKGTFSPGTRITHTFLQSPELENASSVSIRKVTFADGSSWQT